MSDSGANTPTPRVTVGLRGYGRVPPETAFCLMKLALLNRDILTSAEHTNWLFVDQAANGLVHNTLETDATHLLLVDGDMIFPAETALRRLLSHGSDCVGALYFGRTPPHTIVAGHFAANRLHAPLTGLPPAGLTAVDYVGPGLMLVTTELLRAARAHYGDELWFKYEGPGSCGEDLWFCRRLKGMGRQVHLDGGLECGHLTDQAVGRQHWLAYHGRDAEALGTGCFLDDQPGCESVDHRPEAWCDFSGLYADVVDRLPEGAVVVELGCYVGRSAILLAKLLRRRDIGARLFVVDNFQARGTAGEPNPEDRALAKAGGSYRPYLEQNLLRAGVHDRVTILQGDTAAVARSSFFPDDSVDFVFVDADHSYEGCRRDVEAWLPKLKPGGVMAGHDHDWPSVQKAVADCLPGACRRGRRCWAWRKPL